MPPTNQLSSVVGFLRGIGRLNGSEDGEKWDQASRDRLKRDSTTVYDLAAKMGPRGEIWNWGMHDQDLAARAEAVVPGCLQFATDGVSEQLYFKALSAVPGGSAGRSMLEVGCGMGEGLNFLSRMAPDAKFTGLDLSPVAVRRATALLSRGETLRYRQGDAERMPFADGEMDVVISIESSHNYPDPAAFLAEVTRVLKPGGYFSHIDAFTPQWRRRFASLKTESGLSWLLEDDISEAVRAGIRKRLDPGSYFWRTFKPASGNPLLRMLERTSRATTFGSRFVGRRDPLFMRALDRLGQMRASTIGPMDVTSYVHSLGRKAATSQ